MPRPKNQESITPSIDEKVLESVKVTFDSTDIESILVQTKTYKGRDARRPRIEWTLEETDTLINAVNELGEGNWAAILGNYADEFHSSRTSVDLKDKWRNLAQYKPYKERPIRGYMLVNAEHRPILSISGRKRIFRNRYPAEAATKAATKDEFYQNGDEQCTIYLQDLSEKNPPIVHVYRGSRRKELARQIEKSKDRRTLWVGDVEKIKEEKLYERDGEFLN